ncbi:HNH/ENDO VII family nuclease, partial [Paracoccus siganidrum]
MATAGRVGRVAAEPLDDDRQRRDQQGPTCGIEQAAHEEVAQGATDVDIRIVRSTQKWRSRDVNGRRVYQQNDLIDPDYVDPNTGLTNKQLMEEGWAPIGPDGRPINLHHMTQDKPGPMAEVSETFHHENNRALHMYTNQYDNTWVGPDGVRRPYLSAPESMNRPAMIAFPAGVKVWIAGGVTGMRCGMDSLALKVQQGLGRDPHG